MLISKLARHQRSLFNTLSCRFAQPPKKKVFKYEDQHQKSSQQLMQFELPSHRFRSKYSFLNNETIPESAMDLNLEGLNLKYLKDTEEFVRIPKLAHGLNQFLKGQLVENDNGLGDIPQNVSDEVFDQMSQYRSPKNDKQLINLTKQHGCKYFSSTSNISTALIQIYYMFSMFRRPNFQNIFQGCPDEPRIHMVSFRKPITYVLSEVSPDVYSIESDKGFLVPSNYILTKLGTLGEYFLTHEREDIKKLEEELIVAEQKNYYRYSIANDNLFLRSQIDCHDVDEQGKPFVFEIKTRACAPIRYDVQRYQEYMDYPIDKKQGKFESFQREYYDLIRGGFIKYAFQLKIGRMDGAFIAYHNTKKIYGFEYVKLKQIIMRLFGDQYNFDNTFLIITKLATEINDYIIRDLKQKGYDTSQLKIGMYANACNRSLMVMVEVMDKIKEYKPIKLPGENAFYDVVNNMELNPNIFRYEFNFYAFLNGILYRQPDIYFEPNDQIQIKMAVHSQGKLHKIQYLSFLQEAYKIDSFFGNFRYNGMWGKF